MFFELNSSPSSIETCVSNIMHVNTMTYYSIEFLFSHTFFYSSKGYEIIVIMSKKYIFIF